MKDLNYKKGGSDTPRKINRQRTKLYRLRGTFARCLKVSIYYGHAYDKFLRIKTIRTYQKSQHGKNRIGK